MGLGKFNDNNGDEFEDSSPNGGTDKSKYEVITQDEFETFLSKYYNWEKVQSEHSLNFGGELVYKIKEAVNIGKGDEKKIENEDLSVRVYSSIDKRTGRGREKGKDAIRTVIWSDELDRPIGGRTRTHRIKTWRKNLEKKIDSLLDEWEGEVTKCSECGSWMVKKEGQYGEFYGCTSYPECTNTRDIDE